MNMDKRKEEIKEWLEEYRNPYSFGKRLKYSRKRSFFKQEQLAELIGTTKHQISKYENDKVTPDLKTVIKIINVLQVNPNYLLGITPLSRPFEVNYEEALQIASLRLTVAKQYPDLFEEMFKVKAADVIPGLDFIVKELKKDKKRPL